MTIHRGLHLGGREVPAAAGRTTTDLDPHTGEVHATVAAAGPVDVRRAVEAADTAFGPWSALPPSARRRVLLRAADVLESRSDEAVALMAAEVGAVAGWARFNVGLAADVLREAAAAATRPVGDVLATEAAGRLSMAVREPMGVVAAFAPWNAPLILGTRAIAAPLAAGNTVVLKASEDAPLASGLFLAEVLSAAGLPDGVLDVVTNDRADAAAVAEALIGDDRVRAVNFTGSTRVGRIVGELAARHLKPAVLELGGKNAVLVLDDADLGHAVDAVAFGAFNNAGQICMSADRALVHASVAEEFTARLAAKAAGLPHGDPTDPATVIGPLIDPASARRVAELVADAVGHGARVRAGGGPPDGAHHPATVLDRVTPAMRVHHEEAFGPVVTVIPVADDDEAVALADDTDYGLTAGVLTGDARRGLAVARRLRTGIVHVGDQTVDDEPQAPFGGVRASGYGRFGGRWGVEAFTTTRWLTLATEAARYPF
ncbi:aldehyde dehydrogenase family protein [Saccharothrix sp. S26]|uniref:aldehyde dehydrogenase family protein n=1 Tax=Saccharothrix sp. S26 TaxID=2907215 RepID=UPI001F2F3F69|nr:aldehyde dehydrogenase family protein [Saccharothrix sp. S26]MCE7000705.1 aldehyde dehydrogenase family protein [Saccharothrix sp. S26]